jgi:hypothetical protein
MASGGRAASARSIVEIDSTDQACGMLVLASLDGLAHVRPGLLSRARTASRINVNATAESLVPESAAIRRRRARRGLPTDTLIRT